MMAGAIHGNTHYTSIYDLWHSIVHNYVLAPMTWLEYFTLRASPKIEKQWPCYNNLIFLHYYIFIGAMQGVII